MATKKKTTTKKTTAAQKAAKRPKVASARTATPKREKAPTSDLVTFAVRLPKANAAAFHKAAGKGRGSKAARAIMTAFANADESAFRAALKDAKAARG